MNETASFCFADLRNDLYEMKICGQGVCQGCDSIPESDAGEWSEFVCNAVGSRAILMKKAEIQFQLSEIEIYGFGWILYETFNPMKHLVFFQEF